MDEIPNDRHIQDRLTSGTKTSMVGTMTRVPVMRGMNEPKTYVNVEIPFSRVILVKIGLRA